MKNPEKIKVGYLNVNLLRKKFVLLRPLVQNRVVIFMICESKLNSSFPVAQFEISGYTTPCRFDRKNNGDGILLNIREDIPSKHCKFLNYQWKDF